MGVTVNANGLSVVHQGSGGEANATLPDVCLTQCGPPVVPIPYGNNAKSADLADGTTTITMDGGNSVAIKGSKFSKSTGDAGGDKKGVASGTIEAEAEFISASPTVKFEGAGVCRLSDQMTMNKANTMCLGGAQNPSVSVSEDAEGTYTIDVQCCYPDGEPLTNANFKVLDSAGAEIASGQLDNKGKGSVGGLPAGMCVIEYEEDARPFSVIPMRDTNPHKKELSDDEFFEYCAKDCLPFWKSRTIDASRQSWGVFESNLSTDKQFKQMLAYEFHTHFQYQASDYEVHLLATSLTTLFDDNNVDNGHIENYISVLASIVAPDGEVITLTQKIHKDESKHNFLALMRAKGYGDVQTYLQDFDWDAQKKLLVNETSDVLQKVQTRLQTMKQYADREGYEAISVQLGEHAEKVKNTKQGLSDSFSQAIASLKEKSQTIQQNGSVPKVVNQFQNGGSTESGKVNDIVYVQKVMPKPLPICLTYDDREKTPVSNVPYQAKYSSGEVFKGWLDGEGKALIYGVPQQEVPKIEFGDSDKAAQAESNRPAQLKVLKDELQKYSDHLVKETVSYNATQLNLQKDLLEQLKTQTEEELNELRDKKAALDNASLTEYCWELAKSAAEGVGDGVVNYIPDFGEISDYLDALDIDLSVLIYALTTGDIDVLEEALKKVDRGALYLQEATEAMERLILIISDQEIREYLLTLPKLYLDALPADEAAKYSLSLVTQKGIDGAIIAGGTAAGTAAGGVAGPAMAVLLTGATTARSAGKAAEPVLKALNELVAGKKHKKNNHKEKPEDDETELDKICPICRSPKCKNRKRKKKGRGFTDRVGNRHTANMKKANIGFPKLHPWYAGARTLAVHHVIPIEAVKGYPSFENAFDDFSFDINSINNLVTLPMKPILACELCVQCHPTNHSEGIALVEDKKAFAVLRTHEKNNDVGKLNAFGNKLLKKKPFLAYPKAAQELADSVLLLIKQGKFCNEPNPDEAFANKMKAKSKHILGYINDFTWTIDWDSRDYRPDSKYGCSGAKKSGTGASKQTFKENKKQKRTDHCPCERNHSLGKGPFEKQLKLGK